MKKLVLFSLIISGMFTNSTFANERRMNNNELLKLVNVVSKNSTFPNERKFVRIENNITGQILTNITYAGHDDLEVYSKNVYLVRGEKLIRCKLDMKVHNELFEASFYMHNCKDFDSNDIDASFTSRTVHFRDLL